MRYNGNLWVWQPLKKLCALYKFSCLSLYPLYWLGFILFAWWNKVIKWWDVTNAMLLYFWVKHWGIIKDLAVLISKVRLYNMTYQDIELGSVTGEVASLKLTTFLLELLEDLLENITDYTVLGIVRAWEGISNTTQVLPHQWGPSTLRARSCASQPFFPEHWAMYHCPTWNHVWQCLKHGIFLRVWAGVGWCAIAIKKETQSSCKNNRLY